MMTSSTDFAGNTKRLQSSIQKHNLAPLLGGIAGGGASTILLYPLDLIKVRMQVNEEPKHFFQKFKRTKENSKHKMSSMHTIIKGETKSNRTQNMIQIEHTVYSNLRSVIEREGVLGLYQGLSPALIGSAVSWGGYFFIYESIKRALLEQKQKTFIQTESRKMDGNSTSTIPSRLGAMENFVAACTAGAALVLITNPIWLIKTRMQLQTRQLKSQTIIDSATETKSNDTPSTNTLNKKNTNPKIKIKPYKGIFDAMQTIIREEGPIALYKGSVPALMLVSHGGVQFVSYEYLKNHFGHFNRSQRNLIKNKQLTVFEQLQCSMGYLTMGAASKMIASTVTYPLQVIKSRLQQRSNHMSYSSSSNNSTNNLAAVGNKSYPQIQPKPYNGVIDCIKRVWMNEGTYGFFKGCVPNAVRVAPSAAITFVVYESMMDLLEVHDV